MPIELAYHSLFKSANLLSYYPLEGNPNDSKGSINGSATNITFSTANGRFNQGGRSPGASGDGITFGNNFNWTSQDFSFSLWLYPESFLDGKNILGKSSNLGSGYQLRWNGTSGALSFFTSQNGSNQPTTTSTLLTVNAWNFIVVTRTGATVRIYINGSEASYTAGPGSHANPTGTSDPFCLLRRSDNGQEVVGRIDDVGIWDRVLTASEVSELYTSIGGFPGWII